MRLIDADKLKPNAEWSDYYGEFRAYSITQVDDASTVEAIPIEWLHDIMKRQLIFAMNSEMEGTITVQDGLIHCVSGAVACQVVANVIELWEKENETENN